VTAILNKYYDLISPALDAKQAKTLEAMEAELRQKAGQLKKDR